MVKVDDDETQLTLPAYERLKRCRETIGGIATKFPDLTFLPWQLTELQEIIDTVDETTYYDVDIDLLRSIGTSTAGNKQAIVRTVDALGDILKEKLVDCTGPVYTMTGGYSPHMNICGIVADVVSTNANIRVEEPMLVVVTIERNVWCVPLSTMEGFRC